LKIAAALILACAADGACVRLYFSRILWILIGDAGAGVRQQEWP
jgi:hypothetical protein